MGVQGRAAEQFSDEPRSSRERTTEDTSPVRDGHCAVSDLTRWLTDNHRLFREMLDGCVIVSPEGRLLGANPAYCRMMGYSREELLGMGIPDVEAVQSPEEIAEYIGKILSGTKCRFETKHRRADGSLIDLDVLTHVVADRQVRGPAIFCIFRDITERKRLEAELETRVRQRTRSLREVNQDLRQEISQRRDAEAAIVCQRDVALLLAEAARIEPGLRACVKRLWRMPGIDAVGVYLVDEDEGVTLVTHAGLNEDFVRKVHHYDADSTNAALVREGKPWYYNLVQSSIGPAENRDLKAAGISSVALLPFRHAGRVIGCVNVASLRHEEFPDTLRQFLESVASQMGAAVARLKVEEFLRLKDRAIACSVSGIAISDALRRVTYVNKACLELWGFQHESEVLGRPVQDFWVDSPGGLEVRDQLRMTGGWTGEIAARRVDGSTFEAQVAVSSVTDESGDVVATMGSFLDITAQKEAERALLRAEKLRVEAEKCIATGRMAAKVAHEINNPLSGIANCFQLVKQAVPKSHRHYHFVQTIEREIERIGRIVRQMYELSRPSENSRQDVQVDEALADVTTMLAPVAQRNQVRIIDDLQPDLPLVSVTGDALRQVLYNLLTNAIEASAPGDSVHVTTSLADHSVWITVSDDGPGIGEEIQSKVFEPFFSTKEESNTGGLGLGLPICKSIVESLGGTIELDASEGDGTTFRISFPISQSDVSPASGGPWNVKMRASTRNR